MEPFSLGRAWLPTVLGNEFNLHTDLHAIAVAPSAGPKPGQGKQRARFYTACNSTR